MFFVSLATNTFWTLELDSYPCANPSPGLQLHLRNGVDFLQISNEINKGLNGRNRTLNTPIIPLRFLRRTLTLDYMPDVQGSLGLGLLYAQMFNFSSNLQRNPKWHSGRPTF